MKKIDYKKKLIRNTEEKPKGAVVFTENSENGLKDNRKSKQDDVPGQGLDRASSSTINKIKKKQTKLDAPELHSTMRISKKIEQLIQPRKTKSCSDTEGQKLAVEEKVTRRVNFPYDRTIFKDLIPLSSDRVQSQHVVSSRPPLPHKDKEPVLQDFIKPRKMPVYYALHSVKLDSPVSYVAYDNFRLYRLLEKNENSHS